MNGKKFLIVVIILFAACSPGNDDVTSDPVEMSFNVNQDLLGEVIVMDDYLVTFQPPKEWSRLTGRLFDEVFDRLTRDQSDTNRFTIIPRHIFLNHHHGSAMILTEVVRGEDLAETDDIVSVFRTDLNEQFDDKNYHGTEFLKADVHFYQYLIQKDEMVNFKFLFQNADGVFFQLDYVVPKIVYAAESKAIESSIGSINIKRE